MSFDERLCPPTQASRPSIQGIYSVCYLRQSPRRCLSCHSSLQLCHKPCVSQPTYLNTQIWCSPCYHRRIRLRMNSIFQIHVCIVFIIVQARNYLFSYQLLLISCHT